MSNYVNIYEKFNELLIIMEEKKEKNKKLLIEKKYYPCSTPSDEFYDKKIILHLNDDINKIEEIILYIRASQDLLCSIKDII